MSQKIFTFGLIWLCCYFIMETNAYCSLEKMKKFAMEACEHLFLNDEIIREKRSPSVYESNLIDVMGYGKLYDKSHYVRRSNYPEGGYLKVGRDHFRKLSHVNVFPKYKAKKFHFEKKERFKRDLPSSYSNLPYCCYNRCDDDFFCDI